MSKEYVQVTFSVVLTQDNWNLWHAECVDLPGCSVAGLTRDEAMKNIREAITFAGSDNGEEG